MRAQYHNPKTLLFLHGAYGRNRGKAHEGEPDEARDWLRQIDEHAGKHRAREAQNGPMRPVFYICEFFKYLMTHHVHRKGAHEVGPGSEAHNDHGKLRRESKSADNAVEREGGVQHIEVCKENESCVVHLYRLRAEGADNALEENKYKHSAEPCEQDLCSVFRNQERYYEKHEQRDAYDNRLYGSPFGKPVLHRLNPMNLLFLVEEISEAN